MIVDPDAAFDQRLHWLLRQKRSSVKEYIFSRKCFALSYWPSFIVLNSVNISNF